MPLGRLLCDGQTPILNGAALLCARAQVLSPLTVITSRSRRRAPRAQRRLLAQRATYACHATYRPAAAFLPPPILSIPLCAGARRRCACLVRCARPSVRTRHGPSPPTVSPSATALTSRSLPVRASVPPAPSLTVQLRLLVSTGLTRTGCVRCHRPRLTVTVALPRHRDWQDELAAPASSF